MSCTFDEQTISDVIAFHRHSCPGLAIGIRASEYALKLFPETDPSNLVCVTETDMCAVDAIQYLVGCSLGKGNLIHHDHGKAAFSFYDRNQEKGFRLLFTPSYPQEIAAESAAIAKQKESGQLSEEMMQRESALRNTMRQWLMSSGLDEIYTSQPLDGLPPRRAQVLQSLTCEACGDKTMESRTRQYGGQTLCIPCFNEVEQKI